MLPLGSSGRFSSFPRVSGHQGESTLSLLIVYYCGTGFVTDFDFSPFYDDLLCTGSEDCSVSLYLN